MIKLVIFDFDGVIADSERGHYECISESFKQKTGVEVTWDRYCEHYLGYDDLTCFKVLLKDFNQPSSQEILDQLCQQKQQLFIEYVQGKSVIIPGIPEFLQLLESNQIPRSICSGAVRPEIDVILEHANLAGYFTDIVTAENVTECKPHPEGYFLSLKQTNELLKLDPPITADDCVVIEDSKWGITSAKAAGMKCIAVQTSYNEEELKIADYVVKEIAHIDMKLLNSLF